jgi:3-methyladenine DNA glycosylase AlkD
VEGMARFGIRAKRVFGASVPAIRRLAREIGKDHALAQALWESEIFDARLLASLVDDPAKVTSSQMEAWARDFDSWAVCDGCCCNLFDRTPFAYAKAIAWSRRKDEFVKRAGFVLMAGLAVHDKRAEDARFEPFFPRIRGEASDGRNMVKKGVNWALRQIGKRNVALNKRAIAEARVIAGMDAPSARWIASDALRELTSDAVRARLVTRSSGGSPSRTSPTRASRC